jgi:hypothetical protein
MVQASKDNTLYEDPSGALSNGAGASIFAGNNGFGLRRRAVIAFDVAGAVPAGSTVTGAALKLNMVQTLAGDTPVSVHRALADWGEGTSNATFGNGGAGAPATPGDATWLHRLYNTVLWTNAGGDFDPSPSATTVVGALVGVYSWSSPAMTTEVQGWLDNPALNHGWVIIGTEVGIATAKRFESREALNAAGRPVLVVEYTPPCYPDCNLDQILDVSDFGCFTNKFITGNAYADCNADGVLDISDFGCFVNSFIQGCP